MTMDKEIRLVPNKDKQRKNGIYPVFAYGSLKQGRFYHDYIDNAEYCGFAKTKFPCWIMHALPSQEVRNFFFPTVSYGGKYFIKGELYLTNQQILEQLDIIEENGFAYERKQIDIIHPDFRKAWMYVSILEGRTTHPMATKHFVQRNRQDKTLSWEGGFF